MRHGRLWRAWRRLTGQCLHNAKGVDLSADPAVVTCSLCREIVGTFPRPRWLARPEFSTDQTGEDAA